MIDFVNEVMKSLSVGFFLYKNNEGGVRLQRKPSDTGELGEGRGAQSLICFVGLPKTAHTSISERMINMGSEWQGGTPSSRRAFTYSSSHYLCSDNLALLRKNFHKSEFIKAKKTMEEHLNKFSLTHDDIFYFTFVRNPFDQAFSAWRESSDRWGCKLSFEDYIKKAMDLHSRGKPPRNFREASQFWHIRPQYENLLDEQNKVGVDAIFRFEKLEEDFRTLFKLILKKDEGSSLGIHRNRKEDPSQRRNGSSLRFYNEKTEALIREFYKQDFLYFCY